MKLPEVPGLRLLCRRWYSSTFPWSEAMMESFSSNSWKIKVLVTLLYQHSFLNIFECNIQNFYFKNINFIWNKRLQNFNSRKIFHRSFPLQFEVPVVTFCQSQICDNFFSISKPKQCAIKGTFCSWSTLKQPNVTTAIRQCLKNTVI